jgi:hypothetical protein
LIAAALYFLLVEHATHVLPYLPFMILLLCPLMHILMHKGHGSSNHGEHQNHDVNEAYRRGLEDGCHKEMKGRHGQIGKNSGG